MKQNFLTLILMFFSAISITSCSNGDLSNSSENVKGTWVATQLRNDLTDDWADIPGDLYEAYQLTIEFSTDSANSYSASGFVADPSSVSNYKSANYKFIDNANIQTYVKLSIKNTEGTDSIINYVTYNIISLTSSKCELLMVDTVTYDHDINLYIKAEKQ
ncbi:MAG: hypothetical protein R3Y59_10545 [bacterium]